jgi:thiamine biosynthesis protein ThiS
MAKIQLNGKKFTIGSKETIYSLLKKINLINKKVAIEHNGIIIPKIRFKKKPLKNNDKLEIVHFIGGG